MVREEGVKEINEERVVRDAYTEGYVNPKLWNNDEKYVINKDILIYIFRLTNLLALLTATFSLIILTSS